MKYLGLLCPIETQLIRRTTTAIIIIQQEALQKVWKTLKNRLHAKIREDGGHVEHL